jgi:hypothetical protein
MKFQRCLAVNEFLEFLLSLEMKRSFSGTKKQTLTRHWKGYDDGWWVTEKAYSDMTLNMLLWWMMGHWKSYDDGWQVTEIAYTDVVTEKATLMWHWKAYDDVVTENVTLMWHRKSYDECVATRIGQ